MIAAGLPIGVGVLAGVGGFAGTLLLARAMDVSIHATNVVTMIGLGVAIDYSLFVVSRFREEANRRPVPEALSRAVVTTGRAIVFSGLTVAIGLLGFLFFSIGGLSSMEIAGAIVVALAAFYGLTFLPALLAILGRRVNSLRLSLVHPERISVGHGLWRRLVVPFMVHPWQFSCPWWHSWCCSARLFWGSGSGSPTQPPCLPAPSCARARSSWKSSSPATRNPW